MLVMCQAAQGGKLGCTGSRQTSTASSSTDTAPSVSARTARTKSTISQFPSRKPNHG